MVWESPTNPVVVRLPAVENSSGTPSDHVTFIDLAGPPTTPPSTYRRTLTRAAANWGWLIPWRWAPTALVYQLSATLDFAGDTTYVTFIDLADPGIFARLDLPGSPADGRVMRRSSSGRPLTVAGARGCPRYGVRRSSGIGVAETTPCQFGPQAVCAEFSYANSPDGSVRYGLSSRA